MLSRPASAVAASFQLAGKNRQVGNLPPPPAWAAKAWHTPAEVSGSPAAPRLAGGPGRRGPRRRTLPRVGRRQAPREGEKLLHNLFDNVSLIRSDQPLQGSNPSELTPHNEKLASVSGRVAASFCTLSPSVGPARRIARDLRNVPGPGGISGGGAAFRRPSQTQTRRGTWLTR